MVDLISEKITKKQPTEYEMNTETIDNAELSITNNPKNKIQKSTRIRIFYFVITLIIVSFLHWTTADGLRELTAREIGSPNPYTIMLYNKTVSITGRYDWIGIDIGAKHTPEFVCSYRFLFGTKCTPVNQRYEVLSIE